MTSDTGTQGEGSGSAALLRRTPDALIDVERLARAIKSHRLKIAPWGGMHVTHECGQRCAVALATEYNRPE